MTTIFSDPQCFNAEIVSEKNEIIGLDDGKIYVLAARTDKFVESVKSATKNFKNFVGAEELIYHYDICVLEDVESLSSDGLLFEAAQTGANLILPIYTPNVTDKLYIVAKSEESLLDMYIPSMILQAENLTKKAIEEALINLAVQESVSCSKLFSGVYLNNFTDNANEDFIGKLVGSLGGLTMAMAPSRDLYEVIPPDTSYKDSREIINRFVENCKLINRTEKKSKISEAQERKLKIAQSEVNYVFNLFTPNVYSRFALQMMKKNDIELAFDNCINRDKIAANSKIEISVELVKQDVEVKYDPKVIKKLKTNGKFRVYLSNGERTVQVKFSRTTSCIVYVMYLLDKKQRGDDVDTLKITNNQELFCNLYAQVYNGNDGKEAFATLATRFDSGKVKRSRLTDCYSDIRKALEESVSEFEESSLPFYIPNEYSHITVLSNKISVPEAFEKLSFRY